MYQIWYKDLWPLCMPVSKDTATRFGKRLAKEYGPGYIKLKKVA